MFKGEFSDSKNRVREKRLCDYIYIAIEEAIAISIVCTLQLPVTWDEIQKITYHSNHSAILFSASLSDRLFLLNEHE